MNQYMERKVPVLLKDTKSGSKTKVKVANGMAEFEIDGEIVVLPTADAFQRLLKKVAVLEQRLANVDNKANRAGRVNRG